ncbi:J domain-containing protein [Synechococcus elongatus]|uniref:DnaJ domain-containing protein n=1 Tax=Synechococcus elongatus PCC 11802 TaxID=2283154 RepID=A0AAT9JU60_SYNEL|nr:J domain-containing protein [Synechococcus elongatus]QFZ92760.1 J domain-containing protein [Synechococcus elongatus PCC 11802]
MSDHYATLGVSPSASQQEIKLAYRQLAKQYHPDRNAKAGHERIIAINAAYEVLGNAEERRRYDALRGSSRQSATERTVAAQDHYRQQRRRQGDRDEAVERWLKRVYEPTQAAIGKILRPFRAELTALAADPYDDALMAAFESYIERSRQYQAQAERYLQSEPAPAMAGAIARLLFQCLNQTSDALDELERYCLGYNDDCLRDGREMMRIAQRLRQELQAIVRQQPGRSH